MIRLTLLLTFILITNSCKHKSTEFSGESEAGILENHDKKSHFCCVDWGEFQINGANLFGSELETFLEHFGELRFEKSEYLQECGFLSEEEQAMKFYSYKSDFFEVVSYEQNGKTSYTKVKVNVDSLFANNYELTIDGLIFHKNFRPTVSRIFKHWNIDSSEYDSRFLKITDGFSDDAIIFHFNEKGMLEDIEYWSPC
jgi:hypothetical protein